MASCTANCTGSCIDICGNACSSNCSSTCSGGCKNGCGTACASNCTGYCIGGCSGCTATCSDDCYGSCDSGCTGTCLYSCGYGCGGACEYNCTSSCKGCSGTCEGGCSTGCQGTCKYGCSTGCSTTCKGTCSATCADDCAGYCVNECYSCGGCDNTCYGSCSGCSGSCSGGCQGCGDQCSSNCTESCKGSCSGGCEGSCTRTCASDCTSGCKGTCQGTCTGDCTGSCTGTCTGTCSETCKTECDLGCTDNCHINCVQVCTLSLQYTITVNVQNSVATNSGVNYKAAGSPFSSTASALTNYTYDGWYENGSKISSAALYSFTVNSNRTLLAKSNRTTFTALASTSPSSFDISPNPDAAPPSGQMPGNVTFSIESTSAQKTTYTDNFTRTITPYNFSGWSFTNATPNTSNSTSQLVVVSGTATNGNIPVTGTANFSAGTAVTAYYCTFSAGAHGSIEPNTSAWYNKNTSLTLKATADTGYEFDGWSDGSAAGDTRTVTITKPLTIQANFKARQTFTASASIATSDVIGLSTPSVSPTTGYVGDSVVFSATPYDNIVSVKTDDAGTTETTKTYVINGWTLSGATEIGAVGDNGLEARTTSTSVSGAANFTPKSTTYRYKCTFSKTPSNGGSVTPSGTAWYNDGQIIQVEATPADNSWKFVSWSDGLAQRHDVTINGVKNLTATFAKKQTATVTASGSIGGPTVTATPVSTPIYVGETSISFYADPTYSNPGTWGPGTTSRQRTITNYAFGSWTYSNITGASTTNYRTSGTATNTSASALASYTQTGTETVTQYACTFTSDDTSKGTVSYTDPDDSPSWYTSGHSITAVATPTNQTYYAFDGWYNGSTKVSSDNRYTFTVSGSVALVAKFKDRKFTASVSASSTPAPSEVTAALAGTAIAGYQSSNHWIGEWVAFSTNSSVTIYSNQTTDSRLKRVFNFQNWSISGGSTASGYSTSSNPCRVVSNDYTVTANANYTLNTSITEYNCSFNVSPSGGGTISGASSGWYAANARLTLTATPADNTWKFINWTGDASGTDTQTSIVVTSNLQVGAVFAKKQTFTVSASANIPGPSAIYSPTTGPYYVEETNITFTADPDYTNIGSWIIEGDRRVKTTTPYTFYRWTFTGATGSSSGDVNARVVTKQAAASQSTAALAGVANYTTGTPVVERQFSCSFGVDSSTKGSVTYPTPDIETGGKKWYNEGRILSIAAVPNAGYAFDHWSDNVGGDGTREITVDQAYSLIAVFRAVTFNISTSVGDTNIVSTYSTTSTVSYGGTAEIYASVKPSSTSISPVVNNTRTITTTNYSFTHWDITGDCTATQMAGTDPTRYSLTDIYSNISAIAYGSSSTSTITQYYCVIDGTVGGTITGNLTDWYNSGTPLSATAVPSQGYRFKQWIVTGGSVTGDTVTGTAQAGVSWLAEFELIPTYTITYNPADGQPSEIYRDTKTENVAITLRGQTYFKNNYVQDGWARSAGGPKAFNLSANYTANQAESLYPYWVGANCTIAATGYNCSVSNPGGTYAYGSIFSSTATTPSGYTFLGWWQGTTKITQDAALQITVTGDATYTARAVLSSYNVNVVNGNPDAIDSVIIHGVESTSDVVAYDGYSSIEAELKENSTEETISPDGHTKTIVNKTYGFSGWSLVGDGSLIDSTALATAIENIRSDVTATASGQKGETTNYEYTYSGSIGTPDYIAQVSGGGWVAEGGTTDYIIATPQAATEEVKYSTNNDFCYTLHTVPRFDHWTYTGSGTPTSTSVERILFSNVQSPISAVAYGAVDTYDSDRKYLCLGINGLGVTGAAASVNYVSPGSSSTFTCSLISSDYEFDGWYDGNTKLSGNQTYIHTISSANPAPARLTAIAKRKYYISALGSSEVFDSVVANPGYICDLPQSVTVTATLKTTTDTEKYTFSGWTVDSGTVTFADASSTSTTATISALGVGDTVVVIANAVKANAPKYHARFQNKSINLGTISVSKDQTSKIDEQSFLPVTYKYTAPNNCHVFVGWYDEAEGGTLVSSNATYQCPVQADGSEMTLYAKVNFAYANSTIVQWGNASRTLKAFDWLVIRDFINARKRQTYNYVYNTPTNVQPGFTLTANMYNEYTTKLNIPTYEAGETITAACLYLIRDTINGVEPTSPT